MTMQAATLGVTDKEGEVRPILSLRTRLLGHLARVLDDLADGPSGQEVAVMDGINELLQRRVGDGGELAHDAGTIALAAFLARYRGGTRASYAVDLRDWLGWCASHGILPLAAQRAHIEIYLRELEEVRGLKLSTIGRRLSTLAGFYRMAAIDRVIPTSPAEYVLRPPRREDSSTLGLSHLQFEAMLTAARAGTADEAALIAMLGLLGLRVSEACRTDVGDLGMMHGHRVLHVLGKGDKPAVIPLPPQVARDVDRAVEGRAGGPILRSRYGARMTRKSADRIVKRLAKSCGITQRIHPHALRHTYVTTMLDAGVPLRDVQIAARHADPRTTTRYDRARANLDRHGNYILSAYMASPN